MDHDAFKPVIQLHKYRKKRGRNSPPPPPVGSPESLMDAISLVTGVGFFFGFNSHGLDRAEKELCRELTERGRQHVLIHAAGKTERQIYEGITGAMPKTKAIGFRVAKDLLLTTDLVIVVHAISQARLNTRAVDFTYGLAKILVDASDRRMKLDSNLVFIDYASFLQECWPEMRSYFLVRWFV